MTIHSQATPAAPYGDAFYDAQMAGSYRSARKFAAHLCGLYTPRSVVDVGCGRGTWLKAFREQGVGTLCGIDGHWNGQERMIDPSIRFRAADLNQPLELGGARYDLALSLEVAEHLEPGSATGFVESLTRLSDIVMFSAAFTQQGGTNHLNEQAHTYWAQRFRQQGYLLFDLFRPRFWGDPDVEFWYQQNTFLYVKEGHPFVQVLAGQGERPMANLAFVDCVHPALYRSKLQGSGMSAEQILAYTRLLVKQHPRFVKDVLQILASP